ncbi:MAG: DUF2628 domain-containing protein [Armatimonadetes bacterium]|nr:DUF2628 domain-containing protein [Armatimonadota bacterium]MDW8154406.1 DUF2628 domain-containing protein [Armatimonadota bacterium]
MAATLFGVLIALGVMGGAVYVGWRLLAPSWQSTWEDLLRSLSEASLPFPRMSLQEDLGDRIPPPRLSWNWAAAVLGPFWYLAMGLWAHFVALAALAFLSGGLLAPLVWLYCALKANEDLWEARKARWSAY